MPVCSKPVCYPGHLQLAQSWEGGGRELPGKHARVSFIAPFFPLPNSCQSLYGPPSTRHAVALPSMIPKELSCWRITKTEWEGACNLVTDGWRGRPCRADLVT